MKKKSLQERWNEEQLTDNSHFENCKQCKSCVNQDNGDVWSNHYTKSSCKKFPYPNMKPIEVIDNKGKCPYFETET